METKLCRSCGQEEPRAEFFRASGKKDGLQCWCKVCWKRRTREYKREWEKLWIRRRDEDSTWRVRQRREPRPAG